MEIFNSNINNYIQGLDLETDYVDEYVNEKDFKSILSLYNPNYLDIITLSDFNFQIPDQKSLKKEGMKNQIFQMVGLFAGCLSLKELPDISKWNIEYSIDISFMFAGCSSLQNLPDISNWNTHNIINMYGLFYNCSSLSEIPDISK